jgi:CRP-like cAMP-binding protein
MGFTDIFDEMEPADRVTLLNRAVPQDFEDGAVIINEKELNKAIYIILDGEVLVEKDTGTASPLALAELGIGAIIGEMTFLTRGFPSASIVAKGPVEMLCITHDSLRKLVQQDPSLAGRFYHSVAVTLAHRLGDTNKKLAAKE